jgi:hypothetical protein
VLYYAETDRVTIITGLPARATARSFPAGASQLRVVAVTDDGAAAYLVSGEGDLFVAGNAGVQPGGVSGVRDVRVRPGAHAAAIITGNDIALLSRDSLQVIASALNEPRALEFSHDGSRIFVATADEILAVSTSGRRVGSTAMSCRPLTLRRMNADSVLRVSCQEDATVRIVDTLGDRLRVLFVPPFSE